MTSAATVAQGESIQHTFNLTVQVSPEWIHYVTQDTDIFERTYHAGYWAMGAAHDPALGWLVSEIDAEGRFPCESDIAIAMAIWLDGGPLPPRWYRLDRMAALKMWENGVKLFGVEWYGSPRHDGALEDVLLQLTLLGVVRYD